MTARRTWVLGGAGALAALAGIGGALWRETRPQVDEGLWAMRFPTPDGGEIAMASFRSRPLVLNFWATWCPPCVREMPALERFQRAFAAQGWQVFGLAVDGPTPVREFLQRSPVSFPIGLAGLDGSSLSRRLGNDSGGLPFTAVFDAGGVLRHRHLGEASEALMRRWAVPD